MRRVQAGAGFLGHLGSRWAGWYAHRRCDAGRPAGTFYSQGSAGSACGEHDLQLAEDQIPVLASGTPALRDALGVQVEHPAQGIIVGKAAYNELWWTEVMVYSKLWW